MAENDLLTVADRVRLFANGAPMDSLVAGAGSMKKKLNCIHQLDGDPRCQPAFRNRYECDACSTVWHNTWLCSCDDECAKCCTDISPCYSEKIAACACVYLGK